LLPPLLMLLMLLLLRRRAAQRDIHQRQESGHAHLPFSLQRGGRLVD
jgi:hypothetical protein